MRIAHVIAHSGLGGLGLTSLLLLTLLRPAPSAAQDLPEGLYGRITTPRGEIVFRLEYEKAPMTVASFVGLAEGTIDNDAFDRGRPFFDGSQFQRVVPGHVIQGGGADSERAGSSGTPLPNEIHPDLRHDHAGAVGMANGGPHTAQNQFYITLGDRSYLDPDYTVFGEVVEGMDVVRAIRAGDAIQTVRIVRVGPSAAAVRPDTDSFRRVVNQVRERVLAEEAARRAAEEAYVQTTFPNAVQTDAGLRFVVMREGTGEPAAVGDTLRVRYTARGVRGELFGSADARGTPGWLEAGAEMGVTFSFEVGVSSVAKGFDEAVSGMRSGERRLVVVPAALAYGSSGFYPPQRVGKPRFRISPNTRLLYEIEVLTGIG